MNKQEIVTNKLDIKLVLEYTKRGGYNFIFYSVNTAIVRALNLFILPYFLSKLTLAEFGILDYYQMLFSIGIILVTSSAATGMIRFFLFYKGNELHQNQAFGNSFLFGLSSSLFFLLCGALIIFTTSHYNHHYMMLTTISISSFGLFSLLLAYFRAQEKLYQYTLFFLAQNFISIGLTCYGIAHQYGITSFFYAQCFSYLVFIPFYLALCIKYRFYSFAIFKQQLLYSLPLAAASVLSIGLYSIDRYFIQSYLGYEALGTYALLWRFGSIFQFVCIALIDAWPIVLYNADKEEQRNELIAKLINYCCILFATLTLYIIIASKLGIVLFFPNKLYHITALIPSFFLPLFLAEIARMFQSVFGLSNKTILVPIQMAIMLVMQYCLYHALARYSLMGIIMANTISFGVYALIGYCLGKRIQTYRIIDIQQIVLVISLFMINWTVLALTWQSPYSTAWCIALIIVWPLLLWTSSLINSDEKKIITSFFTRYFCKKSIKKTLYARNNKAGNAILYLRSDICATELTVGGSVTHTTGVIQALQNTGHRVLVASSAMPTILKGMNLFYFKQLKPWPLFCLFRWKLGYLRWRLDCIVSTIAFAWQTKDIFKHYEINAIYQRYSLLNATGVLLSVLKKIPLILEYNGSEVWQFDVLGKGKWFKFNRLARLIERINLQYAHTIIVVSQPLKDNLLTIGIPESKILVNPNAVDTASYDPYQLTPARNHIRKHYNIEDKFVFGFVGTFSFWHGIELFAQIIPEILNRKPQAHFLLIGDGPLKDFLQYELASKNITANQVTLTGLIEQHKTKEYLAACDAFFSPTQPNADGTRFFGSPTKIFEYLSMGKPVIASALEQLNELVNPAFTRADLNTKLVITNQIGFCIPSHDIKGFVSASCMLIDLPSSDRCKMGENARQKAVCHYTWDQHVLKIKKFMQPDL